MSFFNKMLASVGIGSAQIDTKLEKDRLKPGEMISGSIEVRGEMSNKILIPYT